jgi:hypothetical protein
MTTMGAHPTFRKEKLDDRSPSEAVTGSDGWYHSLGLGTEMQK